MTFEDFMATVDGHLVRMTGRASADLYDWGYWDAWNGDENPLDVALEVMSENGYGDFR